ncbi:hypothetical protein KSP35_09770 [Aquihabitans sp. G128]|uniref:hypothetical protein n=1 Tax=Aquihabitans sp. G128 TaxID=2849779 RepID=UPI001C238649|nr:hypothetical protein [Aquihabitans sp. G128]QXC63036.1 hypothetical protein KSP35_09770 [Aquihabitans sp. G128]
MDPERRPDVLDQAAAAIDQVVDTVHADVRTGAEGIDAIGRVVAEFLATVPAEPDEVVLLLDYALEGARSIAEHPLVNDPVLVEYAEEVLGGVRAQPHLQAHLDLLLDRIDVAVRLGDPGSATELVELCRSGRRSHRHLVVLDGAAERIIRLAYRLGRADALAAAILPGPDGPAALAHHYWCRPQFDLALDLLAHLAADPDPGSASAAEAREHLLELVGFVETAGEAAVRLPLHLLSDDDRARLLDVHEARVSLFTADPLQVPVHLSILRDNRVVRAALWQALDASQI